LKVPEYMNRPVEVKVEDERLMPERAHPSDAGADLKSSSKTDIVIYPGETVLVDTGVAIKIPVGYVGLVFSRSGQGMLGVSLANSVGVIDSAYRGNIRVLLKNNGDDLYKIEAYKTKVAQLVIVPIMLAKFIPFEATWDDSDRGANGFGSTGQ
jgi:dUTP pyrophosphatase